MGFLYYKPYCAILQAILSILMLASCPIVQRWRPHVLQPPPAALHPRVSPAALGLTSSREHTGIKAHPTPSADIYWNIIGATAALPLYKRNINPGPVLGSCRAASDCKHADTSIPRSCRTSVAERTSHTRRRPAAAAPGTASHGGIRTAAAPAPPAPPALLHARRPPAAALATQTGVDGLHLMLLMSCGLTHRRGCLVSEQRVRRKSQEGVGAHSARESGAEVHGQLAAIGCVPISWPAPRGEPVSEQRGTAARCSRHTPGIPDPGCGTSGNAPCLQSTSS